MKKRLAYICATVLGAIVIASCGQKEEAPVTEVETTTAELEETPTETEEIVIEDVLIEQEEILEEPANPYDFTLCFAGDINLDEKRELIQVMDSKENGLKDCISEELLTYMNEADIMCLNNEFTYSLRGEPLEGKMYTFRANPDRVSILQEMGVDIVKLANNHVYDYGKDAMLDTLDTLESAGITYMGAGRNLEEAMEPKYIELDGKTVAFVAASRAEKYKMTPQATEDSPGILRCYDNTLFLQTIAEARENADFVVAYVHWGTEYTYVLEEVQLTTGKEYIDAGADVVIGAHSHCLQGMEYYNGKPIIYGLGDYWFNGETIDTMLVNLHFSGNDDGGEVEVQVIPAIQKNFCTSYVSDEKEQERIYSFLEDVSINVEIDAEGIVTEISDGEVHHNTNVKNSDESGMEVHFIDVGQGDATLINANGKYMLIDAGDEMQDTNVQTYLQEQGVDKLDYLILTHTDLDHIGGADTIIKNFDIGTVFIGDFGMDSEAYKLMKRALENKGLTYSTPEVASEYTLGNASFTIVAPNRTYDIPNDSSIALVLEYGESSFLFTGDCTAPAENDILNNGLDIDCDVYKLGHHGSDTSSIKVFLDAVTPEYGVISCGVGNIYGCPSEGPLNSLRDMGTEIFRTDEMGTIVAYTDGDKIRWKTEKELR